jgi:hypothetical protein
VELVQRLRARALLTELPARHVLGSSLRVALPLYYRLNWPRTRGYRVSRRFAYSAILPLATLPIAKRRPSDARR